MTDEILTKQVTITIEPESLSPPQSTGEDVGNPYIIGGGAASK